jgi:subtilisin family serine protease
VPIALLDTGADQQHSDFRANRWINAGETPENGIDDDGNGYVDDRFGFDFVNRDDDPDDDEGHGTNVAGVMAAVGDNFNAICGVCWVAEVMTLKVLDALGTGSVDDIAEALIYAADNGARVANMSLVVAADDPTLRAAVDYAAGLDVVQVAAAGNDGATAPRWPAAYVAVLGVIATTEQDQRWGSSNFGSWCELSAPGVNILSLKNNGGTSTQNGTSLAAPHVAGVAALVRRIRPELDAEGVGLVLEYSALDLGAPGNDTEFAWGRLHAEQALVTARSLRASDPEIEDGGSAGLDLHHPDGAGFVYVLLPTLSGRLPGIPLSGFDPADARLLPIAADWLQVWSITHPNAGVFVDFIGALDANGSACARLQVPPHTWEGEALDFAYVTLDPLGLAHIAQVSGPCRIRVQ